MRSKCEPQVFYKRSKYNYLGLYWLLEDFQKYKGVTFRGADKGRMEAISTLIHLMGHYIGKKGYLITKNIMVTVDYTPKILSKRYDYDVAYSMVFTVSINGTPFLPIEDVTYADGKYMIAVSNVSMVFDVNQEQLDTAYANFVKEDTDDDNGVQTERDMAHDEEEMPQPEVQGLPSLREEGHPRVSRVARL